MILEMARIRVLGPRAHLAATIHALQDRGVVQLVDASVTGGLRREDDPRARRRRHDVERALADIERAIDGLARLGAPVADREGAPPPDGRIARTASRLAGTCERLLARERALGEERDALREYAPLLPDLDELLRPDATSRVSVFLLRLRSAAALDALRAALARVVGDALAVRPHQLASGDTVLLLLVPRAFGVEIEHQLAQTGVERAPLPGPLAREGLADALLRLRPRLAELDRELAAVREEATDLARAHGDDLARARRAFHDERLAAAAARLAATSARAFVLDGWVPARERAALADGLTRTIGDEIVVEEIARADWHGDEAPVVLANPRLFAPFEVLTSLLPLPRYGTIDPTPFVAVFFPMLFGVVVGDLGYGAVIAAIAIALRLAGGRARNLSKIATAVAIYTLAFGAFYGELFGDLGTRWFGMHALWFDRREAVLGFLALAIALGLVHLVLGLVIAAVSHWRRDRRVAIGRGLTAAMLVLSALALLVVLKRAPAGLLTPALVAMLIALPIVVILEGATALLDLMTILGHVLSYARVMALGTASVMLAVVANKMYGAFGSAAIGIAFALVFHLVNFAITLFSPTIHVMRLHYVEFFGTFFEPGGGPYQPLRHWSPGATA